MSRVRERVEAALFARREGLEPQGHEFDFFVAALAMALNALESYREPFSENKASRAIAAIDALAEITGKDGS